jgi:hypothetical protein
MDRGVSSIARRYAEKAKVIYAVFSRTSQKQERAWHQSLLLSNRMIGCAIDVHRNPGQDYSNWLMYVVSLNESNPALKG